MNVVQSSHQFADAATAQIQNLRTHDCELIIRQGPENARVAIGKEKDRKPVDPPPIIQLRINDVSDPHQNYLQSPYFFMSCSLVGTGEGTPQGTLGAALAGTLVSSLHRLKDSDNSDGAFFIFGDLSVKLEGTFRLQFNLYEMRDNECFHMQSVQTNPFPVHSSKNFPGMGESTLLTRLFSEQGVRLRLRKEPRTLLRKRGPASDDYQPRQYSRNTGRQPSQGAERQSVTSPASQESVRQGQGDQAEFVESPQGLSHSGVYDQRPGLGRQYSHVSYQGSMSYDETSKRPRTASEHSQTSNFGQQTLQNPQYARALYTDPQQSPFNSFGAEPQQHSSFSYPYAASASPHGSSTSQSQRDSYFAQKGLSTQTGPASPYAQNIARSPDYGSFPPQPQAQYQRQQEQYGTSQLVTPSPSLRMGLDTPTQTSFEGLVIRGPNSPVIPPPLGQMAPMAPPGYGRLSGNMYPAISSRRDSYTNFQSPNLNVNLSAGSMVVSSMAGSMAGYPTRSPVVTTSGSGSLDGPY